MATLKHLCVDINASLVYPTSHLCVVLHFLIFHWIGLIEFWQKKSLSLGENKLKILQALCGTVSTDKSYQYGLPSILVRFKTNAAKHYGRFKISYHAGTDMYNDTQSSSHNSTSEFVGGGGWFVLPLIPKVRLLTERVHYELLNSGWP